MMVEVVRHAHALGICHRHVARGLLHFWLGWGTTHSAVPPLLCT